MHKNKSGFTVLEIVFTILVIGIICFILITVLGSRDAQAPDQSSSLDTQNDLSNESNKDISFEEGLRLQPNDFGVETGKPVADVSVIKLEDGTWRIYAFAQDKGIVSAVSEDGLNFEPEPGVRLGDGAGMPRVIKLNDGKYRMYFIERGGIGSAISEDGLNFTKEDGLRINAPEGIEMVTGISTPVKMPDGKYYVYYSELPRPGEGVKPHKTYYATSIDLVNWKSTNKPILGNGKLVSSAEHPDAVINENGEIVLYFFINDSQKLVTTKSSNGIDFAEPVDTGLSCNDPNIVKLTDNYRVYCGDFDENIGGIVKSFLTKLPN